MIDYVPRLFERFCATPSLSHCTFRAGTRQIPEKGSRLSKGLPIFKRGS